MGRRTGAVKTITVVVPRHGTPAASRPLAKTVANEAKKTGRVFQEQAPVSATDLQGLEDASNWNGLLLNARGERGPQWDVTSQMYHVEIGSNEYFDPTLLFDEPPPAPEEETKMKTDSESQPNPVPPASMAQQDVVMATQSPTHQYPQHVPGGGISMRTPAPQSRYPQYVQPMNGSVPHGASTMTDHMGGNPMYAQQQHPVHMRMNSDVTGAHRMPPQGMYGRPPVPMGHQPPQHGVPIGLSYNTMGGGAPPGHPNSMDPSTMGMRGYSGTPQGTYPPSMHGGMGNTPQYPGGPHNPAPMSGTYGGLY